MYLLPINNVSKHGHAAGEHGEVMLKSGRTAGLRLGFLQLPSIHQRRDSAPQSQPNFSLCQVRPAGDALSKALLEARDFGWRSPMGTPHPFATAGRFGYIGEALNSVVTVTSRCEAAL